MSLQKLIEERENDFKDKFPFLSRGREGFGQSDIRCDKEVIFFHSKTINLILDGVVEMCEGMTKLNDMQHDGEGRCDFERNNTLAEIISQLQTLKK